MMVLSRKFSVASSASLETGEAIACNLQDVGRFSTVKTG